MSSQITLFDFPLEVLEKIISTIDGDFDMCPFIRTINSNGKFTYRRRCCGCTPCCMMTIKIHDPVVNPFHKMYNRLPRKQPAKPITYPKYYNEFVVNNPCRVLPSTLCIMGRVCKTFYNNISKNEDLWKMIYIRDYRNNKPYIRHPKNYKKKYFEKLIPFYEAFNDRSIHSAEFYKKKTMVSHHNLNLYLKAIRVAVDPPATDLGISYKKYTISNLEKVHILNDRFIISVGHFIIIRNIESLIYDILPETLWKHKNSWRAYLSWMKKKLKSEEILLGIKLILN